MVKNPDIIRIKSEFLSVLGTGTVNDERILYLINTIVHAHVYKTQTNILFPTWKNSASSLSSSRPTISL